MRRGLPLVLCVLVLGCGSDPEEGERLALRAELRLSEGALEEAGEAAAAALDHAPASARVQEVAGRVALARRRPVEAVEHFRKAVHLEDSPGRRTWVAKAYLAAGRIDDAADALDDALAQNAYDPRILREAAYVFPMAGRIDEGIRHAENVRSLEPANPSTLVRVASAFLRGGREEDAAAVLRSVDPDLVEDTEDLVILGSVLYELEDAPRAVRAFERAATRLPGAADIAFNLGTARVMEESFREAKESFERVLELRPDDAKARGQLAYCLYRMGRRETAEEELERALAQDPRDPVLQMLALEIRAGKR